MSIKKMYFYLVLVLIFTLTFLVEVSSKPTTAEKGPMEEERCSNNQGWNVTCGGEQGICTSQILCE